MKYLMIIAVAALVASCGGNSATSNPNVNGNANTSAKQFGRQPKADSVRYTAEKLLDIAGQARDFDAGMKGREVVVTGPVDRVSDNTVYFDAGSGRKLYCEIDAANPGPFQALSDRVNDKNRYAKPIVEAVGVFKNTYQVIDSPMTMTVENCSVLSSKEPS